MELLLSMRVYTYVHIYICAYMSIYMCLYRYVVLVSQYKLRHLQKSYVKLQIKANKPI